MHFANGADALHVQVFDGVCSIHDAGHAPHAIQIRKALKETLTKAQVSQGEGPAEIKVRALGHDHLFFKPLRRRDLPLA